MAAVGLLLCRVLVASELSNTNNGDGLVVVFILCNLFPPYLKLIVTLTKGEWLTSGSLCGLLQVLALQVFDFASAAPSSFVYFDANSPNIFGMSLIGRGHFLVLPLQAAAITGRDRDDLILESIS
ncbi:hypothetical protein FF1_003556 [Malus domestica]